MRLGQNAVLGSGFCALLRMDKLSIFVCVVVPFSCGVRCVFLFIFCLTTWLRFKFLRGSDFWAVSFCVGGFYLSALENCACDS